VTNSSLPPLPPIGVHALTMQGAVLASHTARNLLGIYDPTIFLPERLKDHYKTKVQYFHNFSENLSGTFNSFKGHVVVGATGMVVRIIAPLLKSKQTDPAVVVLPQDGRFAISLISGHLGGGNRLTLEVAQAVGAQPVISTATDIEDMPALEIIAQNHNLIVEDYAQLMPVSRRLVEGHKIPIYDPGDFLTPYLAPWSKSFKFCSALPTGLGPQVVVNYHLGSVDPEALILRPRVIFLGLGCHHGVKLTELEDLIDHSLAEAALAVTAVAALATVETRADEPVLLKISRNRRWPLIIFTKKELNRINTPNPSEIVRKRIGIFSVCEAAALLAAGTNHLIIAKKKRSKSTLAAAIKSTVDQDIFLLPQRLSSPETN